MGIMRSTIALSLALLTGCATSRPLLVRPHSDLEKKTLGVERQRITGYVLRGGQHLSFDGYVEAHGENLHFVRPRVESRGLENAKPLIVRDIPRDSVLAVDAVSANVPGTILVGVSLAALVVLFMGLSFAANFHPLSAFAH